MISARLALSAPLLATTMAFAEPPRHVDCLPRQEFETAVGQADAMARELERLAAIPTTAASWALLAAVSAAGQPKVARPREDCAFLAASGHHTRMTFAHSCAGRKSPSRLLRAVFTGESKFRL
jgi:hypothetical protein